MTQVITLARTHAPTTSTPDASTTQLEALRLQDLASNALATALQQLQSLNSDPANLATATARAIRAATALKRLSAMNAEVLV